MHTQELMQKAAEVAPREYDFIVKTAGEINAGPFRNEILEKLDVIVKKAHNTLMGRFGGAMAGIGATVATGIAYSLAGDLFEATKRGLTKTRNYKAMINANPDLKEMPAHEVQRAFSVLHRLNPEFASEPTVAGHFVRKQTHFAGDAYGDTKLLSDLVGSRKNIADTKKLPVPGKLPWETPDRGGAFSKKMEQDMALAADEAKQRGEMHDVMLKTRKLQHLKLEDQIARESAEEAMNFARSGGVDPSTLSLRQRRLLFPDQFGKNKIARRKLALGLR